MQTIVVASGALWLLLRAPNLLVAPRFWAEEAHFVSAATRFGFWESLLYVYPRAGYYSWPANLGATLGVDLLPLHVAPIASTALAAVLQLTPLVATLSIRFDFNPTMLQRSIAGIALITVTSSSQGITWLNTLTSQIHLGILTAVILIGAARQSTARASWGLVAALFLTGLSGAYSVFFLPAFLLTAIGEREPWRARQTCALATAAMIQACVYLHVQFNLERANEKRGVQVFDLDSAVLAAREAFAVPLFGRGSVDGDPVTMGWVLAAAVTTVALAIGVLTSAVARDRECDRLGARRWLGATEMRCLWAWPSVVIPIVFLSFNGMPGGRYGGVPGSLVVATVLLAAFRARTRAITWVLSGVLLISISLGLWRPRYPEAMQCDGASSRFEELARRPRQGKSTWLPSCPDGWRIKIYMLGRAYDG